MVDTGARSVEGDCQPQSTAARERGDVRGGSRDFDGRRCVDGVPRARRRGEATSARHATRASTRWRVIVGPGGGGTMRRPAISPHDTRFVVEGCDMTGAYITRDAGAELADVPPRNGGGELRVRPERPGRPLRRHGGAVAQRGLGPHVAHGLSRSGAQHGRARLGRSRGQRVHQRRPALSERPRRQHPFGRRGPGGLAPPRPGHGGHAPGPARAAVRRHARSCSRRRTAAGPGHGGAMLGVERVFALRVETGPCCAPSARRACTRAAGDALATLRPVRRGRRSSPAASAAIPRAGERCRYVDHRRRHLRVGGRRPHLARGQRRRWPR